MGVRHADEHIVQHTAYTIQTFAHLHACMHAPDIKCIALVRSRALPLPGRPPMLPILRLHPPTHHPHTHTPTHSPTHPIHPARPKALTPPSAGALAPPLPPSAGAPAPPFPPAAGARAPPCPPLPALQQCGVPGCDTDSPCRLICSPAGGSRHRSPSSRLYQPAVPPRQSCRPQEQHGLDAKVVGRQHDCLKTWHPVGLLGAGAAHPKLPTAAACCHLVPPAAAMSHLT